MWVGWNSFIICFYLEVGHLSQVRQLSLLFCVFVFESLILILPGTNNTNLTLYVCVCVGHACVRHACVCVVCVCVCTCLFGW